MTEMIKSNLGPDLLPMHRLITRGLDASSEDAERFAAAGLPGRQLRGGCRDSVTALLSFVLAHHGSEDEVALLYFETRLL